jgi:hypothetical protein
MHDQPTPPGGPGDQPPEPPSPLRESVTTATERIKVIIEAAEKAAAGIIEDAEVQANRYLEQSRQHADHLAEQRMRAMSDLTDSLLYQAETVKRESDQLIAALDKARNQIESPGRPDLTAAPRGSTAPAEAGRGPHLQPVEPQAPNLQAVPPRSTPPLSTEPHFGQPQPGQGPPAGAPGGQGSGTGAFSDGARLLATQMAVAGSSRDEIRDRLRNDFGIEDASPILDGILGPE